MNYFRILSYLKPYKKQLAISIVLTILFTASNIYFLPLSRDLINEISNKNLDHFANHILNAVLLWSFRMFCQFAQYYVTTWLSNRVIIDIQLNVYRTLQKLPQQYYTDSRLGDILSRMFSDSVKLKDAIVLTFWEFIPQTLTFIGVLTYLFILNWKLTLFSLIAVPLFVAIIGYFAGLLRKVTIQIQESLADLTHITQERISNIKLVQAYTMEEHEYKKFRKENMRNFSAVMKSVKFKSTLEPLVAIMHFIVVALVIYFGAYEMTKGHLTNASLASFFTGIFLLIDPVQALSKIYLMLQQAWVSVVRIFELLDTPVIIQTSALAIKKPIQGKVFFDNVSLSYIQGNNVLNHISLEVEQDQIVALVGLSGAGKTSLLNLIPRFYDPTQGNVLIDGIDIKNFDIYSLRSQISFVLQEDILFAGTIFDNVRYGTPNATQEEVLTAVKQANAWEFIENLPKGLWSKVGDRGHKLSGGQKQRISIARAILRNPRILLLDEATSALDSQSEKWVQAALEKLMKNRTTFVIAHRLSTVIHAHKIVVLDAGCIVETGSHQELLSKNGHYAKLYQLQFQKTEKKLNPS